MIFKYKDILRFKYQDINLSRWHPVVSHNRKVNVKTSQQPRVNEKKELIPEEDGKVRKPKILSNENQEYLEKR